MASFVLGLEAFQVCFMKLLDGPQDCKQVLRFLDGRELRHERQFDISRLSQTSSSSERVTPPNTHSLNRLCP